MNRPKISCPVPASSVLVALCPTYPGGGAHAIKCLIIIKKLSLDTKPPHIVQRPFVRQSGAFIALFTSRSSSRKHTRTTQKTYPPTPEPCKKDFNRC